MSDRTPSRPSAACPRCGYDLSGTIATWERSCPLDGVCPECGLRLSWREVFDPALADLRGFYEHRRGLAPVAAVRTWLWTILPWVFWRRVRLEVRVHPRRAWLWLALVLLSLHAVASVLASVSAYAVFEYSGASVAIGHDWMHYASLWTYPIVTLERAGPGVRAHLVPHVLNAPAYVLPAATFWLGFPLMLLALPTTRRLARIRGAHVHRAMAFGLAWLVPLAAFRAGRNAAWARDSVAFWLDLGDGLFRGSPLYLGQVAPSLCATLLFAWIATWWLCCFTIGWRLREGFLVWLLLAVAAGLAAGIVSLMPWSAWLRAGFGL